MSWSSRYYYHGAELVLILRSSCLSQVDCGIIVHCKYNVECTKGTVGISFE